MYNCTYINTHKYLACTHIQCNIQYNMYMCYMLCTGYMKYYLQIKYKLIITMCMCVWSARRQTHFPKGHIIHAWDTLSPWSKYLLLHKQNCTSLYFKQKTYTLHYDRWDLCLWLYLMPVTPSPCGLEVMIHALGRVWLMYGGGLHQQHQVSRILN